MASRVAPIVLGAVGIVICGFFIRLFNDIFNAHFTQYVVNNEYYTLSDLFWDMVPWVVVIGFIIGIITAGIFYGVTRTVTYE